MIALILQGFSQEVKSGEKAEGKKEVNDSTRESTKVIVGKDLLTVEEDDEAVRIKIGNRGIEILESAEGGTTVKIDKLNRDEDFTIRNDNDDQDNKRRDRNRFKGHWAGVEFGYNNYTASDWNNPIPDDIYYMSLHTGKSNNFNINFAQLSLGFNRHIGLVTGLGMTWNKYRFDGNNNIRKGDNGVIEEYDPGVELKKSKFSTTYINLPVLLEFQIPADNNHINISGGIIGAVKLCSDSKMVTAAGDKVKSNSDFSLNVLRYGATARLGYGFFQVYGTYYFTPMFKPGKGPAGYELFPYEIGMALTFNN